MCSENPFVIFIVGGDTFKTIKSHFTKWPQSRLSRLINAENSDDIMKLCDEFFVDSKGINTYTFYRNPDHFNTILDIYRNQEVHCIKHCCTLTTKEELEYYGSDDLAMELCCGSKYYEANKTHHKHQKRDKNWKENKIHAFSMKDQFGNSVKEHIRKQIWYILEDPTSSGVARVRSLAILEL